MTDIFNDSLFLTPRRVPVRKVSEFIAYTAKDEAEMGRRMAKFAARENVAIGMTGHIPKAYDNCGKSSREVGAETDAKILAAVKHLGTATSGDVSDHIGMNRNNTSTKMTKLFEAGRLQREREKGKGNIWRYTLAYGQANASTARVGGVSEHRGVQP
jgi:hypothetical protein